MTLTSKIIKQQQALIFSLKGYSLHVPHLLPFKYSLSMPKSIQCHQPYIELILSVTLYIKHLFLFLYSPLPFSAVMVPPELENLEKPRVTEIQVRIDCNGCVQKIKKALYGINGIYDQYIDFPQQKLIIIGWADPEKTVKAIRKTRRTATICSHTSPQAQPTGVAPEGVQLPPETVNPPPEGPPAEAAPPAEPPKDPPPPENPPPPPAADATESKPGQPVGSEDVETVHVLYNHPPDYTYRYGYGPSAKGYGEQGSSYPNAYDRQGDSYPNASGLQGYGGQGSSYPNGPGIRHEPIYVAHSYNTYKPSHYVTEFVSQPPQYFRHNRQELPQYVHYSRPEPPLFVHYSRPEPPEYVRYSRSEPPQYTYHIRPEPQQYTHYRRPEQYSEYYRNINNGNGSITWIVSDENPNACRIV